MTKRSSSRLTWAPETLQAFQNLKERFTSAPILHHRDPELPFIVEVDASSTGIRAVLSQRHGTPAKMFPCAFYSRKLSSAERNYDVGNHELLAMKAALEEWQHWLEGAQHSFTIHSSRLPGITATLHLLKNRFWCPTMSADTTQFINNCTVCHTSKPSRQLPAGLLQPLPIPQHPWSHIAIDFITDLPKSCGNTVILMVIDRFSKSCRLISLPKLPTAFETAETLCEYVFRFYGLPEDIVSDRGPQFTSRVWAAFVKHLNVNVSLTSGYHPESNGQTERMNQELTRFLRTYCQQN